ncbi:Protein of unknown function [Dokdonella immobilis]|uniref:DUF2752 domain-containing protein n=2 Tax=Dokdonella immobilis TaxID=578942 RepID=A0A1I4XR69_9GAMM|nr:Protein of unknown function [Dokdonella immobilis]
MTLRILRMSWEARLAVFARYPLSIIALPVGALLVCGVLLVADPFVDGSILPPCPFHALTHLYCPGCGTTRALHALMHGHLGLALGMNPLAVMAVPLIPAILLRPHFPGQKWLARLADARLWLPAVLAFTVFRNLPWIPFAWLAPG